MLNILFPKGSARRTFLSRIKMHLHGTCEGARKNVFRVIFSLSPFKIDKKITYQGFSLHYSPGTSIVERFKKNGSYEPEEVAALALVAVQDERPTVFLDIGANIGMLGVRIDILTPHRRFCPHNRPDRLCRIAKCSCGQ